MSSNDIFALSSRQSEWLTLRRSVIAGNVANANTPEYRAREVAPFEATLDASAVRMAATNQRHMAPEMQPATVTEEVEDSEGPGEIYHSGNSVNLDQEMLKAGEVTRLQTLNVNVVRAFHRMVMASAKG